ncbi:hypothetical protein EQG49_04215 [Periweissella cryptocerci]|uniref:SMI1/KNR4 family protein n=1 Tax=Periweissella cryptocerci TaxID=2506420 RepID=A0A4P6YSV0_9LACO|nr:hypothetical protein [Periweissella cryptocerci]QBO35722.1 hypothetical protein EQG49_04215 [Periweissella cryptocerci]
MNKYKFLSQYTLSDSKVIRVKKFNDAIIPEYWKRIFEAKTFENKKAILLSEWKQILASELSNTIAYLETYLKGIEFIQVDKEFYMVYTILSYQTEKTLYYVGGNPMSSTLNASSFLLKQWNDLPNPLRAFYEKLHDGFYYYPSRSMGLDETSEVEDFTDFELSEGKLKPFNESETYNFFSTGMGGYVAIDFTNKNKIQTIVWLNGEDVLTTLNFWDAVDEFYIMGFDE